MPKKREKHLKIRIFWQIPAKTRLKHQYLCGFCGDTVEIQKARLGRWHLTTFLVVILLQCRNTESPFRALTPPWLFSLAESKSGRNTESPFRALTPRFVFWLFSSLAEWVEIQKARLGRWHPKTIISAPFFLKVEIQKARLGRWHPKSHHWYSHIFCRNTESPFRALTHFGLQSTLLINCELPG